MRGIILKERKWTKKRSTRRDPSQNASHEQVEKSSQSVGLTLPRVADTSPNCVVKESHTRRQPRDAPHTFCGHSTTRSIVDILMVNDVSRAYMYVECKQDVSIELSEEKITTMEDHHVCGKLKKAMYGTRPAASCRQGVPGHVLPPRRIKNDTVRVRWLHSLT